MEKTIFGNTEIGKTVFLYTFKNEQGMEMTVSDFGATLTNLWVTDKDGKARDIVLGFPSLKGYEINNEFFFGATVGRNANRVENAAFELNGVRYKLNKNEGNNNLHSGPDGYQLRIWEVRAVNELEHSITFALDSVDGDQGFSGELNLEVTYQLQEDAISITYRGNADQDTIFNPTNHSYFNLNGHQNGDVLDHVLQLNASKYTPIKAESSIPTGEILTVEDTPMDFRSSKRIGKDIQKNFSQLNYAQGYDHNFVIDQNADITARLEGDQSGILMEVSTQLPGVQVYSGNFLNDTPGKNNAFYPPRGGVCFETQAFPNAVNEPNFATPILKKDEEKILKTTYQFMTVN
ncbi:galactose mutarotase [Tetragenococcus halophilus]|uniref:Aldose 1-epimerase n=1 Tax=Tetragenococcus halophilus TaxID=51669 RepID=A0A3G5FHF7_TETHA|nr:aldose epimerase family protein [Tetragenococcus halophilus]AYW49770.1 galactose mutarotase [Tetragenococcus halophilus]GBD63319.1 aldose 1-epimerase [Tetragenococcus halophilus subsp. flandriensis]